MAQNSEIAPELVAVPSPLQMLIAPPENIAQRPELMLIVPPKPLVPLPTDMPTLPDVPPVAELEPIHKSPLFPPLEEPELNTSKPEEPGSPLLIELMSNEPLLAATLLAPIRVIIPPLVLVLCPD